MAGWLASRGWVLVLGAVGVLVAAARAEQDPGPYRSEEGNYSVNLLGKPRAAAPRAKGKGPRSHAVGATDPTLKTAYTVAYHDLAPEALHADGVDRTLEQACDEMLRGARFQPGERRPVRLDGHPGMEVDFTAPAARRGADQGVGRLRAYMVGGRLYQVMVVGPASKTDDTSLAAFLDSFQLNHPVEPIAGLAAAGDAKPPAAPAVTPGRPTPRADPRPAPVGKATGFGTAVDPDEDCTITADASAAMIRIPPKPHDLSVVTSLSNAPRILRAVPGDFLAEVRIGGTLKVQPGSSTAPGAEPYQSAGLLLMDDSKNYVHFERAQLTPRDFGHGSALKVFLTDGGREEGFSTALAINPVMPVDLRMERVGGKITMSSSEDEGRSWQAVRTLEVNWPAGGLVGVHAIGNTRPMSNARFERLKVEPR